LYHNKENLSCRYGESKITNIWAVQQYICYNSPKLVIAGELMKIALVIGSTISTIKDEAMHGRKLLIVRDTDTAGKVTGEPYVAVDTVGSGTGDLVLVTDGSSARFTTQTTNAPVDAVIVGVIDSLEMSGKVTYRKE
jgi:microcompartment protein CcmK/EutM